MARFVVRRALGGLAVVFIVTVLVFVISRVVSDPAAVRLGAVGTDEQIALLRAELGLDRPILEQFADYVGRLLVLDFGNSLWQDLPARDLVFDRLPATFRLVAAAVVLTVAIFIPLGILASLRPGSIFDRVIVVLSLGGISAPPFWVGAILILVFAVQVGVLPSSGAGTWQHLILPAVTLALPNGARVAQITRTTMIEQVSSPYVAALRLRGFGPMQILGRHVLRNALIPIVTILFYETAQAMSGSVIIETVFAYPGVGRLLIQAVQQQDLVLLQAGVLVLAVLVVVINIVADLMNKLVDPRVELN